MIDRKGLKKELDRLVARQHELDALKTRGLLLEKHIDVAKEYHRNAERIRVLYKALEEDNVRRGTVH